MDSASTSQAHIAAGVWDGLHASLRQQVLPRWVTRDSNSFQVDQLQEMKPQKGWHGLHLEAEYTAHAPHIKVICLSMDYFAEWIMMKAAFISYEVFLAKSQ